MYRVHSMKVASEVSLITLLFGPMHMQGQSFFALRWIQVAPTRDFPAFRPPVIPVSHTFELRTSICFLESGIGRTRKATMV